MSVDYTRTEGAEASDSDTPMFAGTPVWERGRKRRGSNRVRAGAADTSRETVGADAAMAAPIAEQRTFDPGRDTRRDVGSDTGLRRDREATRETVMSPNGDDAPFVARERTTMRRERSVAPLAIGGGLVALAALAGAGWYATRPADTSMTPGATSSTSIATTTPAAPTMGDASTTALAANTPPASAASAASTTSPAVTHRMTTTTVRTTTPRRGHSTTLAAAPERPVTSRSATSAGVNAATTAPSASAAASSPATTSVAPPAISATPPVNTPAPATAAPAETTPPASTTSPDATAPGAASPQ